MVYDSIVVTFQCLSLTSVAVEVSFLAQGVLFHLFQTNCIFSGFLEQLDKAAPQLADGVPPIMVAKIDADKYRSLIEKYDIRYVLGHCLLQ